MRSGTAPCGARYAVRRSGSAVGYCALSIRCGTRDEEGFHGGIAHFTEHTLFRGTKRKSASVINSYLDRLGGELNAYTTKEEIVIHATVLKEDLGKAARLLFELATEATFPDAEIETERGVVLDEIISYKDNPYEDVYDKFEGMLFEGHPLGKPILGTAATVKRITPDELRRFVRTFFVPARMAFTVVADIDEKVLEKKVLRLMGKVFDEIPGQVGDDVKPVTPGISSSVTPFDKTVDKRHHEVNAVIGSRGPSLYDEELLLRGLEGALGKRFLPQAGEDAVDAREAALEVGFVAAEADGDAAGFGVLGVGAFHVVHPSVLLPQFPAQEGVRTGPAQDVAQQGRRDAVLLVVE